MAFTFNGTVVKKILYGSKEIDNVYYSNGKKYLFQKRYISVKIEQYNIHSGYVPIKDVGTYNLGLALRGFTLQVRVTFSSTYNVSVKYVNYDGGDATASGKNFSILTHLNAYGGSTIKTFQSSHGVDGLFQQKLNVYGKEGSKCINCNHLIIKTFVNKRGTHYCPNCQR